MKGLLEISFSLVRLSESRGNLSIKREQNELARYAEREKGRLKTNLFTLPNFSIKRMQNELARYAEREKVRL